MAKRGENIRRRKDGRWEGRYIKSRTSERKPVWGYVYGSAYADVKEILIRKKAEAGFYALSRTDLIFRELAEQWLASIRVSIKESSFAHYQYTLRKYILPVLKDVRVSNLSENILEQAMQVIISPRNQEHRPLGHSSAKECLSMLRRICKYATHLRLIRPMEICVHLPKEPHKENEPLELFIPNIALQLYTVFDKTMLGSLVDTLQVGYYSQAEKIIKIILVAISSLFTVLLPRFSYLSNQHGDVEANRYFVSAIKYTYFMAIPLTIGCICVSDYFVPLFFGLGYDAVSPLMKILAVLFIVMSIEKLLGTILIAYSKQNIYTTSVVAASIVNITLNLMFILVFQLDAIGVAIASVIAEFVAMLIQLFNLPTCFHKYSVLMASKNYIIAGVGMAVSLVLINIIPMGVVGHLAISILLGAVIYFGLLIIIKDDIVVNVEKDFITKLRR